jgi:hypothetical protein
MQRNPSGPDAADMRRRAPGFALFGRNAGGADRISPGIDLTSFLNVAVNPASQKSLHEDQMARSDAAKVPIVVISM